MPCLRQMSDIVSPLARSRSASRSNRATSSAFLRLLMGPSRAYSTRRLPFRLDQFSGGRPVRQITDIALQRRLHGLSVGFERTGGARIVTLRTESKPTPVT